MFACVSSRRNVGRFSRTLKNRKHPAKCLMNRILLHSQIQVLKAHGASDTETGGDVDIDGASSDQLVFPATYDSVEWPPKLHRRNSYRLLADLTTAKVIEELTGIFGQNVISSYICKTTDIMSGLAASLLLKPIIKIRGRSFCTSHRERRKKLASQQSWFAIKAKDVPAWCISIQNSDMSDQEKEAKLQEMLYGQFRGFYHIHIPRWRSKVFSYAECHLFQPTPWPPGPTTMRRSMAAINSLAPILPEELVYIDLNHVLGAIALGPLFAEPLHVKPDAPLEAGQWVVMPLFDQT